jgi:hypothetical protein
MRKVKRKEREESDSKNIGEGKEGKTYDPPWSSVDAVTISVDARTEVSAADTLRVEEWHFGLFR